MSRPSTRPLGGRADLLRILAEAPEGAMEQAANLLGYEAVSRKAAAPDASRHVAQAAARHMAGEPVTKPQSDSGEPLAPVPFWRLTERQQAASRWDDDGTASPATWPGLPKLEPPRRPLSPWSSLVPRLRNALAEPSFTRAPDIAKLVRLISRGEPLTAWPRKMRRRWPQRLHIMEDFATRLTPTWRDQKQVSADIARLLPHDGTDITRLQDGLNSGTVFGAVPDRRRSVGSSGVPILVMGDLGLLGASPEVSLHRWMAFALERRAEGRRCIALTPAAPSSFPEPIRKLWSLVPWEETPLRMAGRPERADQADRLLGLLSHHMKIPPGLLRDVRRLYPAMSAATEIQAWRSPHLVSPHPIAATLSNAAKEQLRAYFRAEPLGRKREIYRLVRKWCGGDYDSVYFEAVLSLGALADDIVDAGDMVAAVEFIQDMAGIADRRTQPVRLSGIAKPQVERYFREMRGRVGRAPKEIAGASEAYDRLSTAVAQGKPDATLPEGYDPAIRGGPVLEMRRQRLIQRSGSIYAAPVDFPSMSTSSLESGSLDHSMSPLADITTRNGVLAIWEAPFWRAGAAPSWASDYGTDAFGPWVESTIADAEGAPVRQRMRWMPPGCFIMGSREDEPERFDNEGPRHEVQLSHGYWLFDKPVTQALWEAVMGSNPSDFVDPKRPVEQVSWDDAVEFLRRINTLVPGLDLALPTEAQWEYACRSGTEAATYAGPMDILGEHNASILDAIAWYGGNSGVNFDLDNGWNSSDWREKQYEHTRAGTRPVGLKVPNAWGLYDMLGNVWEWCADELRTYKAASAIDPFGETVASTPPPDDPLWKRATRDVRPLTSNMLEQSLAQAEIRAKQVTETLSRDAADKSQELERLRAEAQAHTSRAISELKSNFASLSEQVAGQLSDFTNSFNETTQQVRSSTNQAAAELEQTQSELKRQAKSLPEATKQSAEAMRRALQDELSALDSLTEIPSRSSAEPIYLSGAHRALRGGSWRDYARGVRAAGRGADDRGRRLDVIGFRCARVRAPGRQEAEPAETGPGRAERQPAPARSGGAELFSFDGGDGKPMAALPKGRGFVVRSDCQTLTFESITRPDWASAMGRDRYGLWVEFTMGEVVQRMRWIAPGRFLMGSPDNEEGRYDDEGPRHEVTLTRGYWLFDTPVTQALWSAVGGEKSENPSHFKGPLHPVESVSWHDACAFMAKINAAAPDLDLVLPTEAQWEYACRAGRAGMNYAGSAAALKDIAWFGENSGDETKPVKQLRGNDWGLYDMLGNVLEWCADDKRGYTETAVTDPVGALDIARRALRGGSWYDNARDVRAALRNASDRGLRSVSFGFRCARVRP